jgi:hypothetical protein
MRKPMKPASEKRPPGRPYTGKARITVPARFDADVIEAVDEWAEQHRVVRSEAIRRLVELGLKATRSGKGTKRP